MTPSERLLLDYVDERVFVARRVMADFWYGGDLEGARRYYRALVEARVIREGIALRLSVLDEIRTAAA